MKKTLFNCLKFFDKKCPNSNDELFITCRNQPKVKSAISQNSNDPYKAIDFEAIDGMNERFCKKCEHFVQRS